MPLSISSPPDPHQTRSGGDSAARPLQVLKSSSPGRGAPCAPQLCPTALPASVPTALEQVPSPDVQHRLQRAGQPLARGAGPGLAGSCLGSRCCPWLACQVGSAGAHITERPAPVAWCRGLNGARSRAWLRSQGAPSEQQQQLQQAAAKAPEGGDKKEGDKKPAAAPAPAAAVAAPPALAPAAAGGGTPGGAKPAAAAAAQWSQGLSDLAKVAGGVFPSQPNFSQESLIVAPLTFQSQPVEGEGGAAGGAVTPGGGDAGAEADAARNAAAAAAAVAPATAAAMLGAAFPADFLAHQPMMLVREGVSPPSATPARAAGRLGLWGIWAEPFGEREGGGSSRAGAGRKGADGRPGDTACCTSVRAHACAAAPPLPLSPNCPRGTARGKQHACSRPSPAPPPPLPPPALSGHCRVHGAPGHVCGPDDARAGGAPGWVRPASPCPCPARSSDLLPPLWRRP